MKTINQELSIQEIIDELEWFNKKFPKHAVNEAIRQQDNIEARLINCLEEVRTAPDSINSDYWLHIYACYLLAEFRSKQAFPLLIDLVSLPEKTVDSLFGDLITESMENILASTYDGNFDLLKRLVENDEIDDISRLAGLGAIVTLYMEQVLTREELVESFSGFFALKKNPEKETYFWTELVNICLDLKLKEFSVDCRNCFKEGLVLSGWLNDDELEDESFAGEIVMNYQLSRHHFINDTVKELGSWACFREESPRVQTKAINVNKASSRNKTCPCGSGKKFKKCCLNKSKIKSFADK